MLSSAVTISEVRGVAHSRARAKSSITVTLSTAVSVDGGVNTLIDLLPPPRMIRSPRHHRSIDPDRQPVGQRERGHSADLHAGELHRLVRRGKRGLAHLETLAHHTIHVEPGRGQYDTRDGPWCLTFPDDDDGVGRVVGRVAVCLAERGGVSEGRIAWHDLVIHPEPEEMGDDLLLRIHDAWRTTTNDSS